MSKNVLSALMEISEEIEEPILIGKLWMKLFPEEWKVFRRIMDILESVGAKEDEDSKIYFTQDQVIKTGLVLMAQSGLQFYSLYTQEQIQEKYLEYLLAKEYQCGEYVGDWIRVGHNRVHVTKDGFEFQMESIANMVSLLLDTVSFAKRELGGIEEGDIPIMRSYRGEA